MHWFTATTELIDFILGGLLTNNYSPIKTMLRFTKHYAPKPYRQKSNITGSFSIKKEYEQDYQELRKHLFENHTSIGEYLVECYRELDKIVYVKN